MSEQAPAGWYPDGQGNERYWDGTAWTESLRSPTEAGASPESADVDAAGEASTQSRTGAFAKVGAAVKKAAADKKAAKEELNRKQALDAEAAGALVTSGVFGTSTVEIYANGWVRIASWNEGVKATGPRPIDKKTPYERLRSIKFTQPEVGPTPNGTSALEGAVGPAMASLMKGGKALMKSSAPGLAMAGLAHIASAKAGKSFLTITTDKQIHTLNNQTSNGYVTTSNKGHNEVGLALEAAGNAMLGVPEVTAEESAPQLPTVVDPAAVMTGPQRSEANPVRNGPSLSERLRELAELHREGILSDEEFAAAKAKLLGAL